MPTRFEEDPTLLSPEAAERVVERFAERQAARAREEAAELERAASLTNVQDLADLLGTTAEDIQSLAQESREVPHATRSPLPPMQIRVPRSQPLWPLHAVYLGLIGAGALLFLSLTLVRTVPPPLAAPAAAPVLVAPPAPVVAEVAPPNAQMFEGTNWQEREIPVMGRGVLVPPAGIKVRLATQWGKPTLTGPPGLAPAGTAGREPFRASINSLIDHFEKAEVSKFTGTKIDFKEVPKDLLNAELPLTVGWHRIEASDGAHFYSALLPDLRFAKDRAKAMRLLAREIDRFVRRVVKP